MHKTIIELNGESMKNANIDTFLELRTITSYKFKTVLLTEIEYFKTFYLFPFI